MGMLVLSGFCDMVVHVQRVIIMMVVCQSLGVRHGIGQIGNSLLLTPRRKPHQSLPQNGEYQKSGTAASRHTSNFTDFILLAY
jgi:hypothetical protein